MYDYKRYLFLMLILGAAFTWGYKRDTIFAAIDQFSGHTKEALAPTAKTETPVPAALPPPVMHPPQIPPQAAKAPPPENPYQRFMNMANPGSQASTQSPKTGALANTLDSIRRSGIEDQQIVRRNAYFEKLSQQLKELKGEAPPAESKANSNQLPGGQTESATEGNVPLTNYPVRDNSGESAQGSLFDHSNQSGPPRVPEPLALPPVPEFLEEDAAEGSTGLLAGEEHDPLESERKSLADELDRLEEDFLE